ncbi:MAG: thioesterase family protein [Anaerolineae bacterium]|nr:thioesterase family protein [Anaerolineae bacterium]
MNSTANKILTDFPVVVPIVVRFRDLDAMGHVNNAVYLTYFEMARVAYHQRLTGRPTFDFRDFDFILAEVTCRYRSPAYLGETLLVGIRVASVGRKSFVFEYEMRDQASGRLVAEGRSVQVMYDYREQRSKPVSDEFLAKVEALQGQPVAREGA